MELFTLNAIGIGFLLGAFVVVKCIVLPNLPSRSRWNTPQQYILPGNTPRGIAGNDCLLGTTATLTHVLSAVGQLSPSSTAHVHLKAQEVLRELELPATWDSALDRLANCDEVMEVWDILRSRLGIPEANL